MTVEKDPNLTELNSLASKVLNGQPGLSEIQRFKKIEKDLGLDFEVFALWDDFHSKLKRAYIFRQEDFDFVMVERLEEILGALKTSESGRTSLLWIDEIIDFGCNVYCRIKANEQYPVDENSDIYQRNYNKIYRSGCMTGCTRALSE